MSAIREQAAFAAALLDPSRPEPDGLARWQGGRATRRFAVYRNNVVVTLIEALRAQFPAVARLMGEHGFSLLARRYVSLHPPLSPVLHTYGATFADYLRQEPALWRLAFIADVAQIEYAYLCAYHAPEAVPLAMAALTAVQAQRLEDVRFDWHPSALLIRSDFPAFTILADNLRPEEPPARQLSIGEDGLVVRPGTAVNVRILAPGVYEFLSAIREGNTLGAAADQGAEAAADFDLTHALSVLMGEGCVTGLRAVETAGLSCPEDQS